MGAELVGLTVNSLAGAWWLRDPAVGSRSVCSGISEVSCSDCFLLPSPCCSLLSELFSC